MKPHEIHALLVKNQITQSQIAAELGVSVQAVNGVLWGKCHSRRVCEHIADKLKKPVEKLWPELAA